MAVKKWMASRKAGGLGGVQRPQFANNMIRTTLLIANMATTERFYSEIFMDHSTWTVTGTVICSILAPEEAADSANHSIGSS